MTERLIFTEMCREKIGSKIGLHHVLSLPKLGLETNFMMLGLLMASGNKDKVHPMSIPFLELDHMDTHLKNEKFGLRHIFKLAQIRPRPKM